MLLRTPADIGAVDFRRQEVRDGDGLAAAWDNQMDGFIRGFMRNGRQVPGAIQLSGGNYFDARIEPPSAGPEPIPWNGFPRALDRWHRVLTDPTPEKMAAAERSADVLPEQLYYFEESMAGRPQAFVIDAHELLALRPAERPPARRLRLGGPDGAEVPIHYRQQDEYVEWHADRDDTGRVVRLSFTSEPPEYWELLAQTEKDLVLALYKELVGEQVQRDDLFYPEDVFVHGRTAKGTLGWIKIFSKGAYNGQNKWNTTHGAVHLTHGANTLGAEVNLAARAARVWAADHEEPADIFAGEFSAARIACAGYGAINRSSDPNIGEKVGLQVTAGNRVTLNDPVGLYMKSFDLATLQRPKPEGGWENVDVDVFRVWRGDAGGETPRILHAKLQAPAGADWVLGDCRFEQRKLERGGQIARKISMVIYADVLAGGVSDQAGACLTGLVCRHPDRAGFLGIFDPRDFADCSKVSKAAWASAGPDEGPAGHGIQLADGATASLSGEHELFVKKLEKDPVHEGEAVLEFVPPSRTNR